ncbi:MAG: hypothetical protein KGY66_08190, partial [Candidatus Thermoplasmatota archaeon]|nr:hypothetical protein [Candidatus Thermoplasmatota archaeon]
EITIGGVQAEEVEGVDEQLYSATLPLSEGENTFTISVVDKVGHATTEDITIEYVPYVLTVNEDGYGTVQIDPAQDEYQEGTEVTLTADPGEGWEFVEWTGTDETGEEITITMDEDKDITAVFEAIEYDLTINIDGEGSTTPAEGTHTYQEGDEVTIVATPAEGWEFVEWQGTDETGEEITITMDEDKDITAVFEEVEEEEEATADDIPGFTTMLLILSAVVAVAIYYNKKEQ